jgi:hypothetical protein
VPARDARDARERPSGAEPGTAVATRNPIVETQAITPDGFLLDGTRLDTEATEVHWVLDQVTVETAGVVRRASTTGHSTTAPSRPPRKRSLTF